MTTDDHGARGADDPAVDQPPAHRSGLRPAAILRSLLLGASVFALAALTGALLAGAAPAVPAGPPGAGTGQLSAAPPVDPALTEMFGRSMIYTGSAGLAVSISGLVMVGRRRRLW